MQLNRHLLWTFAACAMATFGWGGMLAGQTPQEHAGSIVGRVVDGLTESPLDGVLLQVEGTAARALTDSAGRFAIEGIPPGIYSVRARRLGFEPAVRSNVVVGSGKPLTLVIRLSVRPLELDSISVQAAYFRAPADVEARVRRLESVEVRRAPGVNEDVVRAVGLLPGVGVTSGGRNDLAVRGGAPYENLFVVDRIEVPNVNHFGSQGSTGGPLSMINVEFVDEASFSSGGFSVRHGDRTASVNDIRLREGADRLSGTVNLSATGFGTILEGPLGAKGSVLASVRRSYLDLIFKAAGFSFIPSYWDFQTKAVYRPDAGNELSFLLIGALNDLSFSNEDDEDRYDNSRILAPNNRQYFGGLTWNRFLSSSRLSVTLGRTYTRFETTQTAFTDGLEPLFSNLSTEGETSLRAEWTGAAAEGLDLTVGTVARYAGALDYEISLPGELRLDQAGEPAPLQVDTSFSAFRSGTYASLSYRIGDRLRATAGLRGDYYGFLESDFLLSPRLGLSLAVGARSALYTNVGRYRQPPSHIWLVGDSGNRGRLEPIRSDHLVLGVETRPRRDLLLQIEGYYKRYADYPTRLFRPQAVLAPSGFEDATDDIPFGLEPLSSEGTGRVFGLEVFAQKKLSEIPLYGLLSLSLSRSEFESIDRVARPGRYDARFIGTALVGYRIDPRWEVSGKFRLATGLPTTPFIEEGPDAGRRDYRLYNGGERFPTFHALDLRLDRRFSFRGWQLELYIDVQNVYARNNVTAVRWDPRTDEPEFDESLGILPTIGVNVEF
jgi:hypothetical protein